jgi:predicted GTPase
LNFTTRIREYYTFASISGSGTGDFWMHYWSFPIKPEPTQEEVELPRFVAVGRPNAGKSSFINALIGKTALCYTILQEPPGFYRYKIWPFWFQFNQWIQLGSS